MCLAVYEPHTEIIKALLGVGFDDFIYCSGIAINPCSAFREVGACNLNIFNVSLAFIVNSKVCFHDVSAGSRPPIEVKIN